MSKRSTVGKFIENERKKGSSDLKIRNMLLDAGWQMDIIQHAMSEEGYEKTTPVRTNDTKVSSKYSASIMLKSPIFISAVFVFLVLLALFI